MRYILCVVGYNLLFILAGLLLVWGVGEAYLRLSGRFGDVLIDIGTQTGYWHFVPGVGLLAPSHSELTLSNGIEYWTVQHTNSLGFFDREPINPERSAESCHITIIGDSFVEAKEVPISQKVQVRLEDTATHESPHLDITTSAFGIQHTGQISQLPFYDRYARRMSPDMLVLVFTGNDLSDNSTRRYLLSPGYIPNRLPYGQAARDGKGGIRWIPPSIDFDDSIFSHATESLNSWGNRTLYNIARVSYFIRWLSINTKLIYGDGEVYEWFQPAADSYIRYRAWVNLLEEKMTTGDDIEVWGFTSMGFEQFKHRVDHDGAALLVLVNYDVGGEGSTEFNRLRRITESLNIPTISMHDYIINQGGRVKDAHWNVDYHWSPTGHQWAAEAILEHIEEDWEGKCPEVDSQPDVEVDWVAVEEHQDSLEYKNNTQILQKPFGLWHRFHTPKGEAWVQSFPTFDLEEYQSVHKSVTSRSPAARSGWDLYLYDDGLTYVKKSCNAADVDNSFFLHVVPKDDTVLPSHSQSIGFDNLDFRLGLRGMEFDGLCMVSTDLPDYDIATIRTGQIANDSEIWSVYYNFALPDIMESLDNLQQSDRKPDIRSNFDVYIDDDRLLYAKDSCNTDDRDIPFFLHVFPANENDLPDARKGSGFDNLDFELLQKGGESEGACFAAVDLPKYDIASIRTGQWLRDEGNVWEASINFGE